MGPARGDHNNPTVAVARCGDRDSSRTERVRGWWRRNQGFILRHQDRIIRAAAALAAEGDGATRSSEPASKKQEVDPVMRPARGDHNDPTVAAARRGDRDSSRTEPVRRWWHRNQGFVLTHQDRIIRVAAARSSEPASHKAMVTLHEPAVGEVPELDCAVCLEDFTADGRRLRTMHCSHSFHQRCIFDWLLVDRRCPMCRYAMEPRTSDEEDDDEVKRELVADYKTLQMNKFAAIICTEESSSSE